MNKLKWKILKWWYHFHGDYFEGEKIFRSLEDISLCGITKIEMPYRDHDSLMSYMQLNHMKVVDYNFINGVKIKVIYEYGDPNCL